MRIHDVPTADRPRERLFSRGPEALSDRELLALLLGSGTEGCDAVELASRLVSKHGTLYELSRTSAAEIATGLPGLGRAKAARIVAAFQLGLRAASPTAYVKSRILGSRDLADVAAPLLRGLRHERVVVIVCNDAGNLIRTETLTEGAAAQSLLPVREVLSKVLALGGAAFGIAHNHPSGRTEPSQSDREVTAKLANGADTVGLRFLDHVITTDRAWARIDYN